MKKGLLEECQKDNKKKIISAIWSMKRIQGVLTRGTAEVVDSGFYVQILSYSGGSTGAGRGGYMGVFKSQELSEAIGGN